MEQSSQHQLLVSDTAAESVGDKLLKKLFHAPLKQAFVLVETWFNLAFGTTLNPLYCLGSLTFFFLWVVLITGIYVYIFFDTSIITTYESVEYITNEQWYLGGIMRSLHRYASDAAMLTTLLHIFREFALDRYRGFRWFSWFTGVAPLWVMALLGITGYWLVWDQLAQYIAINASRLMDVLPYIGGGMSRNFLSGGLNDRFFTLITLIHMIGGPLTLIFLLWVHVKRISSVDQLGPRRLIAVSFLALLVLSLIKPAVSHQQANMSIVPVDLNIDWYYLNAFPLLEHWSAETVWVFIFGLTLLISFAPWLPHRRTPPAAEVHLDHCNGCGQCLEDCPYDAVSMRARTDGAHWEKEAFVDPDLCASCGICMGSCPSSSPFRRADKDELITGINIPVISVHQANEAVKEGLAMLEGPAKVLLFSCSHGADTGDIKDPGVYSIVFPCIGMLPSSFIDYALKSGADGVMISGCRSSDCHYRCGNEWIEQRLRRERIPGLKRRANREHIDICWAAETDKKKLLRELDAFRQRLQNNKD